MARNPFKLLSPIVKKGLFLFVCIGTVTYLGFKALHAVSAITPKQPTETAEKSSSHRKKAAASEWDIRSAKFSDLVALYKKAWNDALEKANEIRRVDEDNERLKTENTLLKFRLESIHYQTRARDAFSSTRTKELKLVQKTGSKTGRPPTTLSYKPPEDLNHAQLNALGISYFKAREDEKAAVIFTSLANEEGEDAYHTAKHYLLTGVSWYRLENYSLADTYFTEVLKAPDSAKYHAAARIWKALAAKKMNKEMKSQYWLKELLEHNPKAPETAWVNILAGGK